jgi:hypothetical protein
MRGSFGLFIVEVRDQKTPFTTKKDCWADADERNILRLERSSILLEKLIVSNSSEKVQKEREEKINSGAASSRKILASDCPILASV